MPYVKIDKIKVNLKNSINYICNQKKTEGQTLIGTYNCSYKTADKEFELIANTNSRKQRANANIGYHIKQSFKPGEVTPEEALKIGKEFAKATFEKGYGGDYQYVIATHTDKDHIHNHIIFNATNLEGKKYNSNKKNLNLLRAISDKVALENNIDIINEDFSKPYKSYKEYSEYKKGTSFKEKLKNDIDFSIKTSKTFDAFLEKMKNKNYEIKNGKHIAFKSSKSARFTRSKSLGENYTEERIKERIDNKAIEKKTKDINSINKDESLKKIIGFYPKSLDKKYIQVWKTKEDLKNISNTLNFLSDKNIDINNIDKEIKIVTIDLHLTEDKIKSLSKKDDVEVEKLKKEMSTKIKHLNNLTIAKDNIAEYLSVKDKEIEFRKDQIKKSNNLEI